MDRKEKAEEKMKLQDIIYDLKIKGYTYKAITTTLNDQGFTYRGKEIKEGTVTNLMSDVNM